MNLNRIFRLQKRECKMILDYSVDHVMESMQDLKMLTVFDRLYLKNKKLCTKYQGVTLPNTLMKCSKKGHRMKMSHI